MGECLLKENAMSLTLYYHPLSSFCHKVLVALYEHDITFAPRVINLADSADRDALRALWPLTKFPVLQDRARGRDVAESSIIIEYLDQHYAGPHKLIDADGEAALAARLWDRICDQHLQGPIQEIVRDRIRSADGDMAPQRAALLVAYRMVDQQVATRQWLAGDGFSMADCSAAPALFYGMTLQPFPADCGHLHAYFERLMARPSVQRVLGEARPYFTMYPFAEAIPQRFR